MLDKKAFLVDIIGPYIAHFYILRQFPFIGGVTSNLSAFDNQYFSNVQ